MITFTLLHYDHEAILVKLRPPTLLLSVIKWILLKKHDTSVCDMFLYLFY